MFQLDYRYVPLTQYLWIQRYQFGTDVSLVNLYPMKYIQIV